MKTFAGLTLLAALSTVLFFGCTPQTTVENKQVGDSELEKAVKEFYAAPHGSDGQPLPPSIVNGVSVEQRFEELSVVAVDLDNGRTARIIARKFTAGNKTYWKVEPFNERLIQSLQQSDKN